MSEPIEGLYFNWLCAKVNYDELPLANDFLRILHTTEFVWTVPGDQARAENGMTLRDVFLDALHLAPDPMWYDEACSVLEMMISFAENCQFETDIPLKEWFWTMIDNLRLGRFRNTLMEGNDQLFVEDTLHRFVWRLYNRWGLGGLWPLQRPREDQREVEIWYQFSAYLEDRGLL